jgi:hypothetical protein
VQGLKDQYWSWWMSSFALTALWAQAKNKVTWAFN